MDPVLKMYQSGSHAYRRSHSVLSSLHLSLGCSSFFPVQVSLLKNFNFSLLSHASFAIETWCPKNVSFIVAKKGSGVQKYLLNLKPEAKQKPTQFCFYVIRIMHFAMKLYNDQRNAQVLNLFSTYFCLICFGLSFSPSSRGTVYKFGSG
jgi:hypothetical protein